MKAGTKVFYELITDSRFSKDPDGIKHEIENLFNNLLNSTEGIFKVENLHAITPYLLNWTGGPDDTHDQYRMNFTLITQIPLTKNQIYTHINKIQPRHLKFRQPA